MASLKQQLASRADWKQKTIELTSLGGEALSATIRRLTVVERDELIGKYKLGSETDKNIDASIAMVAMSLVSEGEDTITEEEVRAMPAALVDELAKSIMDYNGWTKAGKAALDDQFRPAT